jgi:hypothetical protein
VSKIDEGGAAFPSEYYADAGMSMRDYFAAAALQGLLADGYHKNHKYCNVAEDAYMLADAMIEKGKEASRD